LAAVRSQALVIRTWDVFETSTIATLFSRELGKVSGLAKGARRLKSPMQGGLDLLGVSDIVLLHKASDALDLIIEASPVERFDHLRRDLAALYAGYYVAELLSDLTDFHDPHPRLFDAATVTLRHLGDASLRPRRVVRFELACLRELGLMPAFDACAHCGVEVDPSGDAFAFGLATGGVICPECRPGQPHVATLSGRTLGAIRTLSEPGSAWKRLELDPPALAPVRATLGAVISHVIGHRPRLLPYLGA
jgi:DNA repair protein RecO (recombination protein O)